MIEFRLPSLGADMDEGTLLEWRVGPGDRVKRGQIVAVVDTSKAAVDIECWQEGTVGALLVQPAQTVPVDTVLALLLEEGESTEDVARRLREQFVIKPQGGAAASTAVTQAVAPRAGRRPASPVARRRAEALGIDLDGLTGSGPRGVITLDDVERAAAVSKAPASGMRQAIAAAMSRSKREIPHYYIAGQVPMARALRWLAEANARRSVADRLLPAVLLFKAVARALQKYPEFNGTFRDGAFHAASRINPGIAISLRRDGLMAPALLDAGDKDLATLMRDLTDLVRRVRAGSLRSSELTDATVTLTYLGDQGVESVFGVIYPPQVALIGLGSIAERPWVEDGKVIATPLLTATLAADHRVSDGHRGALFLAELREQLQQPEALDGPSCGALA
ncbi:MAG: 2-oxo acid dehydrogenase subunit E2 [Methyloversatilis sp.]|jgi:pyruvate dehydrogenase E2 component (dihydrolipoamide acetyltransferase)|nr:2-oxo acid dehydrogenase subunit E2 [Methyloversatilis sp.]MBP6193289.1 2-oxo acid dehydrogenase subunit E2 [Methyloversatilis sp.]MBP9117248.1 2-oxo acid dehydrogenase subunit E2 [Methyloversatilis sp.]